MTGPYPQQRHPQQPYPQQPYPQQPPPPRGPSNGHSTIAVTAKFMWLAWFFFFIKPKIFVNGRQVAGAWGRTMIPVQPGQHHVHVHVPYFLPSRIGPADLTVPVQPGQTAELEYRAPLWSFSAGSLGPPPQEYKGLVPTIVVSAAALLVICFCCALTVIPSSST